MEDCRKNLNKEKQEKGKNTEENETETNQSENEQQEVGQETATPAGEAEARQGSVKVKLSQQLEQLKKEEAETFAEIGKRILKIESVLKGYTNIHKSIRTANDEAVILWRRMKDHREEREELERAYEEAQQRTGLAASSQINQCDVLERAGSSTQADEGGTRKGPPLTASIKALRTINTTSEKKKRVASSPPQVLTPGKKIRGSTDMAASETPRSRTQLEKRESQGDDWRNVKRKKRTAENKETGNNTAARRMRGRRPEAVAVKVPGESSYADILRQIKTKVDPGKCGAEISAIRRTRGGEILVEIKKRQRRR